MRIIYALTITLGVFTPTFTITTANSIGTRIDDVASDVGAMAPQQLAKRLGDVAIDASERDLVNASETREAKIEEPAAVETEEPVAAMPDEEPAKPDEESADASPVTVPIEEVCEALVDAAVAHRLPIGFFARLLWQESKFDQWARSPVGALGVAQFMPPTAAAYGLIDPFDPIKSVAASARFLRELREQFGNLGLAAAAYNAGGGRIKRWLNGQSALPEETRNYVHTITGHPPQRWTVQKPLEVSVALPKRAPCDGVEGLSSNADPARQEVQLTGLAVELIAQAETARRAKIAAARAARHKRYAAAKAKGRKVAISRAAAKAKAKVRVAMVSAR